MYRGQFIGPTVSPYGPRIYWSLTALAWYFFRGTEEQSADIVYSKPGQTLAFPDVLPALVKSLGPFNSTCYTNNCTAHIDPEFEKALTDTPISLPTAPAFTFYLLTLLVAFGLILFGVFEGDPQLQ